MSSAFKSLLLLELVAVGALAIYQYGLVRGLILVFVVHLLMPFMYVRKD